MSNGSVIEINDVKIELIERNKELERIRKENEELKNQMAVNYLIKTFDDFQTKFSKSLETIQGNVNSLSARVSNIDQILSDIVVSNNDQSAAIASSLEFIKKDLDTLSARASNNDNTLTELKESLIKQDDTLSKQNKTFNPPKTDKNSLGGFHIKHLDSMLILQNNEKNEENWKELTIKLPYASLGHGAQFLNNHLYIFGGQNEKKEILSSTYKLSKTLQWEKMKEMNETHEGISNSNVILNDRIWVMGGWNGREWLKSVEMYNPLTNEWKYMRWMVRVCVNHACRELKECRYNAAAAAVNRLIFCCGGWNEEKWLNSVECYDPSSNIWTFICDMPEPSAGLAAVGMNGNLIVMGGLAGEKYLRSVWILDTTNKNAEWFEKQSMSFPRRNFCIAKRDDNIFICGGFSEDRDVDNVEIFDGNIWQNGPKLTMPRRRTATTLIPITFAQSLV